MQPNQPDPRPSAATHRRGLLLIGLILVFGFIAAGTTLWWRSRATTGTPSDNVAARQCLVVEAAQPVGRTCDQANAAAWELPEDSSIRLGEQCLAPKEAATQPDTAVVLSGCDGTTAQKWNLKSDGSILNLSAGLCLTAGPTRLTACDGSTAQQWELKPGRLPKTGDDPAVAPPPTADKPAEAAKPSDPAAKPAPGAPVPPNAAKPAAPAPRTATPPSATKPVTPSKSTPTPTPAPKPTPAPTPTPAPAPSGPAYDASARVFNGDFETGNFSQWSSCQNRIMNGRCSTYNGSSYVLTLSESVRRQGRYAARFELRDGDVPNFGGGERTEVASGTISGGTAGQERWYQWSTMFDANFQTNMGAQGYALTDQWHDQSNSSPPLGMYNDMGNNLWGLRINKQSSPGNFISNTPIRTGSLNRGSWQDIKMRIKWSTSDTTGFIELWHNGNRQTFSGPCAGQTRCYIRTMTPGGGDAVYFKQGLYRSPAVQGTSVVYKDGFVAATSEAGLGSPTR